MKTVFLITARLKSTRLPNKLLREVCGRPIFAHMIDRLKLIKGVDQIVICTSTNPQDDPLLELAKSEGVACFRGDEDDVIKRLADAAAGFDADYVLSITADCPFSDPVYAEKIIDALQTTGADLVRALDLPHGAYSYGIKAAALRQIIEIKDDRDTCQGMYPCSCFYKKKSHYPRYPQQGRQYIHHVFHRFSFLQFQTSSITFLLQQLEIIVPARLPS